MRMALKKGFSLIELLITVIIITILASVALPAYEKLTEKARVAEAKSILGSMRSAQIRYSGQNSDYSTSVANLDITLPNVAGTVSQGKYFNYTAIDGGTAIDATAIVARATRNTNQNAGYSNYAIEIRKNGTFVPDATAVNFM